MVILNKGQAEIEVKNYKINDKIKIMFPDKTWTKYHFTKSEWKRPAKICFAIRS